MKIEFRYLSFTDFPLLLKWLETNHVKAWWDKDIAHTKESIAAKYSSYINNSKIRAYIIYLEDKPIGYIQIYNAYDFIRSISLVDLPLSLGAIDFYIGEERYLGQGIAKEILRAFNYHNFDYILVDPDINNLAAIKTYEKAGFKKIKEHLDSNKIWMMKKNLKVVSAKNAQNYKWQDNCDGWWLKRDGKFTVIEEMMPIGTFEIKHFHSQVEQFFYCLEGELHIEIDSKEYILHKNEGIAVKAGIEHQLFNRSTQNVRFLVISCPNAHEDRVDL